MKRAPPHTISRGGLIRRISALRKRAGQVAFSLATCSMSEWAVEWCRVHGARPLSVDAAHDQALFPHERAQNLIGWANGFSAGLRAAAELTRSSRVVRPKPRRDGLAERAIAAAESIESTECDCAAPEIGVGIYLHEPGCPARAGVCERCGPVASLLRELAYELVLHPRGSHYWIECRYKRSIGIGHALYRADGAWVAVDGAADLHDGSVHSHLISPGHSGWSSALAAVKKAAADGDQLAIDATAFFKRLGHGWSG